MSAGLSTSERIVLAAVVGRWRETVDEDQLLLGDTDCLADDTSIRDDVVHDCLQNLKSLGLAVALPGDLWAPTLSGMTA